MDQVFFYKQYLIVFLLCFSRNYSLISFLSITRQFTTLIKTGLTLSLTVITFYMNPLFTCSNYEFIMLLMVNVVYGFCLAFLLSLPFHLIEMNGALVDNFRGETVGGSLSRSFVAKQSTMFNFLNMCFLVYFVTSNGIILFIKTLLLSYSVFPLNSFNLTGLLQYSIDIIKHVFTWFGIISFPSVMASLLVDVIFAFSAVVVPNLNTFFLGFPIKSMILILLYFIFTPTLFFYVTKYFHVIIRHLSIS